MTAHPSPEQPRTDPIPAEHTMLCGESCFRPSCGCICHTLAHHGMKVEDAVIVRRAEAASQGLGRHDPEAVRLRGVLALIADGRGPAQQMAQAALARTATDSEGHIESHTDS